MASQHTVPLKVKTISAYYFLCSLFSAVLVFLSWVGSAFSDSNANGEAIVRNIIIFAVIAILYLAIGVDLLRLLNWARITGAILSFAVGIFLMILIFNSYHTNAPPPFAFFALFAIISLLDFATTYYLLFNKSIKLAFQNKNGK